MISFHLVTLTFLLLSFSTQSTAGPFILLVNTTPEQPEVFEPVKISMIIRGDGVIPVRQVSWDFGDGHSGTTILNMTTQIEFILNHTYVLPNTYYIRANLRDALNRTVGDVLTLHVVRQKSIITLKVDPNIVNTTKRESWILQSTLFTKYASVPNATVQFQCGYNSTNWLTIGYAKTDQYGKAMILYKPVYDGSYDFRVIYSGDVLVDYSEARHEGAIATPEFPSYFILVISLICCCVLVKLKCRNENQIRICSV